MQTLGRETEALIKRIEQPARATRLQRLSLLKASASAPAGSVKRKNGSDARLAIREMKRPDGDIKFIIHVAAVSCAATAVPETRLANQILRKTRFRQALGVAFIFMGEVLSIAARHRTPTMRKVRKNPESAGQRENNSVLFLRCT